MGLFGSRPAWQHKDPAVRRDAVAALSDPDILLQVLRGEEDAGIARLAVERVVGLGRADLLLSKLRAGEIGTMTAIQATMKRLEELQQEAAQAELHRDARSSLDPAQLLHVIAETKDLDVAMEALARIQDQRALVTVVRRGGFTRVIDAARERITDPSVLREMLAERGLPLDEQRKALERLGDPGVLEKVALADVYPSAIRCAALELLRDPEAIARVARGARNPSVRSNAIERLEDDELCVEIATTDADRSIRNAAVSQIRKPEVLERLALSTEDSDVRSSAIRRLKDPGALERLSRASDWRVRELAAGRISDPALLRRLVDTEKNHKVQGAIALRLRAPELVEREAKSGPPERREAAIAKLKEKETLESIIRSEPALAHAARARLRVVSEVEEKVQDLTRQIESLKASSQYRRDLEWQVAGDSQSFEAYMLTPAGRRSPLAEVESLEAEISKLRRSLD